MGVLNLPNFDPRPGTEAVISGWGSIQNFLKDFQTPMELDVLKYLLITVMDYKNCQEAYSPRLIYPGQFCAKSSKVKENASEVSIILLLNTKKSSASLKIENFIRVIVEVL